MHVIISSNRLVAMDKIQGFFRDIRAVCHVARAIASASCQSNVQPLIADSTAQQPLCDLSWGPLCKYPPAILSNESNDAVRPGTSLEKATRSRSLRMLRSISRSTSVPCALPLMRPYGDSSTLYMIKKKSNKFGVVRRPASGIYWHSLDNIPQTANETHSQARRIPVPSLEAFEAKYSTRLRC